MKPPKTKCCADRPRCARCPIRLLSEGRMPAGFTVRKRRLVTVAADGSTAKATKKDAARAAKRVAKMGRKRRRPAVTLAA